MMPLHTVHLTKRSPLITSSHLFLMSY